MIEKNTELGSGRPLPLPWLEFFISGMQDTGVYLRETALLYRPTGNSCKGSRTNTIALSIIIIIIIIIICELAANADCRYMNAFGKQFASLVYNLL
jgi:hypothetical protein